MALDFQISSPMRLGSSVQHRNPVHNVAYLLTSSNLIESYLMGKIQDQSVSTYVFNSLSIFTLAMGI
jgi:hypothetical protein